MNTILELSTAEQPRELLTLGVAVQRDIEPAAQASQPLEGRVRPWGIGAETSRGLAEFEGWSPEVNERIDQIWNWARGQLPEGASDLSIHLSHPTLLITYRDGEILRRLEISEQMRTLAVEIGQMAKKVFPAARPKNLKARILPGKWEKSHPQSMMEFALNPRKLGIDLRAAPGDGETVTARARHLEKLVEVDRWVERFFKELEALLKREPALSRGERKAISHILSHKKEIDWFAVGSAITLANEGEASFENATAVTQNVLNYLFTQFDLGKDDRFWAKQNLFPGASQEEVFHTMGLYAREVGHLLLSGPQDLPLRADVEEEEPIVLIEKFIVQMALQREPQEALRYLGVDSLHIEGVIRRSTQRPPEPPTFAQNLEEERILPATDTARPTQFVGIEERPTIEETAF